MSRILQSDALHDCRSIMWHCTNCGEDWCMGAGEEPKFCPLCGILPQAVVKVVPTGTDD